MPTTSRNCHRTLAWETTGTRLREAFACGSESPSEGDSNNMNDNPAGSIVRKKFALELPSGALVFFPAALVFFPAKTMAVRADCKLRALAAIEP